VRLPGKRDTLSLRSIDAAADFVRERIGRNPNRMRVGVLYRLEAVRTKEDAVEAANALRALLEAEGSLLTERAEPGEKPNLAECSASTLAKGYPGAGMPSLERIRAKKIAHRNCRKPTWLSNCADSFHGRE